MGLIDCASGNSIWRGYSYFKENKVLKLISIGDNVYEAYVLGNSEEPYHVLVNISHPRKSKRSCPHADRKRIICKHIIAAYFTACPGEAERLYREAMEYEAEEERRREEISDKLPSLVHKMKKAISNPLCSSFFMTDRRGSTIDFCVIISIFIDCIR